MEIYLKNSSALDLVFKCDKNVIEFEGKSIKPDIRRVKDMKDVVYDKEWMENADGEKPLYLMFRGVCNEEDKEDIEKNNLRYDITIIFPSMMGVELPKTKGHYHPNVVGSDISYPEIYEVLHGKAHYIMQKIDKKGNVVDAYIVKAEVGEKIIIPPGYGHITVNPVNDILIMANWSEKNFVSDYGSLVKYCGAAYFEIRVNDDTTMITNEKYSNIAKLREVRVTNPKLLELEEGKPMYKLVKNIGMLDFLVHPQNHIDFFKKVF